MTILWKQSFVIRPTLRILSSKSRHSDSSLVRIIATILGGILSGGIRDHSLQLFITLVQPESELIDSSSAILHDFD